MIAGPPERLELPEAGPDLDAALAALPEIPAVFLIHTRGGGAPYLARTALLGRRVRRLLREVAGPSAFLNLRTLAASVEYWPAASRLETSLTLYALARRYFPDDYARRIKLRLPSYVRLTLQNAFPRTQITTRLARTGLQYGPFRSRASAEAFEASVLEHFQIRRCQEDLEPSPGHPGCIYGEMNHCLRPCQAVVSIEGYATEVRRVVEFLETEGRSLKESAERARDRCSAELEFEEAARQHRRLERIEATMKLRDDLAAPVAQACGVAVLPARAPDAVELYFLLAGCWMQPVRLALGAATVADRPISLDQRLREAVAALSGESTADRAEHLALLARWYYSSWRDGEWLRFPARDQIPYRRLVNAIHRVATARPHGA